MTDGLVAALARAQLAFPAIVKSHTNPAFKGSQYADVADVLAAVRPVLAAEGIVVTQSTTVDEVCGVTLLTTVTRDDGSTTPQSIQSEFPLYVQNLTAQQVGSLLTYHRRYQLCAILGVHPVGDDDDGNLAATVQVPTTNAASSKPVVTGDPYALAAATPPEKPLAAMTAGEMARYGESIGIRVTVSKADILRQLEPYVLAASGAEPFDLPGEGEVIGHGHLELNRPDPHDLPFNPTVANAGTVRKGANSSLKAET